MQSNVENEADYNER